MRNVREVLRMGLACGVSSRDIGRSLRISHFSAQKYIRIAQEAGLDWDKIAAMSDASLERLVRGTPLATVAKPLPDYACVHQEMKKKGVTLELLWQEYKEAHPDGYQETQFRQYYHAFTKTLRLSLRQTHKAGSTLFVDYAGQTVPIHDRNTGGMTQAQIFVAVLGASNYTFAEATADQGLECWIGSHVRAFEYFGGVTEKTVSDNLKAGVTSPCRYEPEINRTYADMIAHYGTVVIPARVRHPKDKAKVEAGVQMVERWILAALRNRKFFSLEELNEAIAELLIRLNGKSFQKLPGSRLSVFKDLEEPALKPLPVERYEYARWKKARVNIDYHIELEGHYYSAPYLLVHQEVTVRYTARTVEVFHREKRVASHPRSHLKGQHTTVHEHMPRSHQEHLSWTPTKMIECAGKIGRQTACVIERILNSRQYPELGYRSCLGILRLARPYSELRLEAACARAARIGAYTYKSVKSILVNGLDRKNLPEISTAVSVAHQNIRGGDYFDNN
ncbi:MAG: IS21 family transposase [Candidatus Omnitrophota bacterium]